MVNLGWECSLSICYSKTCFVGHFYFRGKMHLMATSCLYFLLSWSRGQPGINPFKMSYGVGQDWILHPTGLITKLLQFTKEGGSIFQAIQHFLPSMIIAKAQKNKVFTCGSAPEKTTYWVVARSLLLCSSTILCVPIFSSAELVQNLWK